LKTTKREDQVAVFVYVSIYNLLCDYTENVNFTKNFYRAVASRTILTTSS